MHVHHVDMIMFKETYMYVHFDLFEYLNVHYLVLINSTSNSKNYRLLEKTHVMDMRNTMLLTKDHQFLFTFKKNI